MRAILYVRVSKGDEQDPESQLQALRAWAAGRGWRVVAEQTDRITGDPVRRGRNPPGLVAALDFMRRRRAEVLVIFAADRLVRSPRHLLELVEQVQMAGGRVASYEDGSDLDTTTDAGELFLFLKGWIARMELRLRRTRTKAGLQRVVANGQKLGRPSLQVDPALARHLYVELGNLRAVGEAMDCSIATLSALFKKGRRESGPHPVEIEHQKSDVQKTTVF